MILVSLENVKNAFWVLARLPQRLKSTFFENFSNSASPFSSKTLILAFEANSALSYENETKIVKITNSAYYLLVVPDT